MSDEPRCPLSLTRYGEFDELCEYLAYVKENVDVEDFEDDETRDPEDVVQDLASLLASWFKRLERVRRWHLDIALAAAAVHFGWVDWRYQAELLEDRLVKQWNEATRVAA